MYVPFTSRQTCCGHHCLVRPWCAFCGAGQVAMLCLMSLVHGMECLALKGYALCVNAATLPLLDFDTRPGHCKYC